MLMPKRNVFSRSISVALVLAMVFSLGLFTPTLATDGDCVGCTKAGTFTKGTGSIYDPWQISTAAQLNHVREHLSSNYILTANIDLSGMDWTPIGDDYGSFAGAFDGDGYVIRGLKIGTAANPNTAERGNGLFGRVGSYETSVETTYITNLGVENAAIYSRIDREGADLGGICHGVLAGEIINSGVTNCYTTGTIRVDGVYSFVGGLTGYNTGVHPNFASTISECYSEVSITVNGDISYAGGLIGGNGNAQIANCYATGSVTVNGYSPAFGGFVGVNTGQYASITDCYSTGAVSGIGEYESIGGFAGKNADTDNSMVGCHYDKNTSGVSVGVGDSYGIDTYTGGVSAQTTAQMKTPNTYINWDFQNVWYIDGDYPQLCEHIFGGSPAVGSFMIRTPKQLDNVRVHLDGRFMLKHDIDLTALLELNGGTAGWTPIGTFNTPFTGTFSGEGHSIDGLWINSNKENDLIGLFGCVRGAGDDASQTIIEYLRINIGEKGIKATGVYAFAGGLAGLIDNVTMVYHCSATGNVSATGAASLAGGFVGSSVNTKIGYASATGDVYGTTNAGGLAGANTGVNAEINFCYATGKVTGGSSGAAGGLVGSNINGTIGDCYAVGDVTGNGDVGGLVGGNYASSTIDSCYAVGAVYGTGYHGGLVGLNSGANFGLNPADGYGAAVITNSYWNTDVMLDGISPNSADEADARGLSLGEMSAPGFAAMLNENTDLPWGQDAAKQSGLPYLILIFTYADLTIDGTPPSDGSRYDFATVSVPFVVEEGFASYQIVMVDSEGNIVPRSWYADGRVYAKTMGQRTYDAVVKPAVTFTDTDGMWMAPAVEYMGARGIVNGVGGGLFDTQATITRAHFVTMLMRALGITDVVSTRETPVTDYDDVPDWAREHVITAKALGLTIADADGKFDPNAPIPRQEMFFMAYEAMEVCGMLPDIFTAQWIVFSDWDNVKPAFGNAIQNLAKLGLVNGNADGSLNPNGQSTRAEGAQFLYNILRYDAQ